MEKLRVSVSPPCSLFSKTIEVWVSDMKRKLTIRGNDIYKTYLTEQSFNLLLYYFAFFQNFFRDLLYVLFIWGHEHISIIRTLTEMQWFIKEVQRDLSYQWNWSKKRTISISDVLLALKLSRRMPDKHWNLQYMK